MDENLEPLLPQRRLYRDVCDFGHTDGYYGNGQCKECTRIRARASTKRQTLLAQKERAEDGVPNGHRESLYCKRGHLKTEFRKNGNCTSCQAIDFQIWYKATYVPHPKPKKGERYICRRGHEAIAGGRGCLLCNRITARKRYAANPEREHRHYTKWLKANPDKAKSATNRWQKANPDRLRANHSRRYAALRGAVGDVSPAEWAAILKKYKNTCQYCFKKFAPKDLTQDHVVPLQGKGVTGANYAFNVLPACISCNSSKKNRMKAGIQHTLFDVFRSEAS